MLPSFARQTVNLLEPALIFERGEEVEDWSTQTRTPVTGCLVVPGGGERDLVQADGVVADYTVYFPPSTIVPRRARIELPTTDGDFILMGEPEPWIYGMSTDHVRASLRRRDG